MPHTNDIFSSEEQYYMSQRTLKLRLCGRNGYNICARFGKRIKTPYVDAGGYNFRAEVLRSMDLPIIAHVDQYNFLSTETVRHYIDSNDMPFDNLKNILPDAKSNTKKVGNKKVKRGEQNTYSC